MKRPKNFDLIVAIIIAALNVIWVLFSSPLPIVGIILGLPLVFILPGYTITRVILYKQSPDASRLLLFSLGLSVSISILSGLALNLLPFGLQATSWAMILGAVTVVFALLAMYLRLGAMLNSSNRARLQRPRAPIIYASISIVAAIIVTTFSIIYSVESAQQQPRPGFTQFWILSASQPEKSCAVRLGVRSFEKTPMTYRITMSVNAIQLPPFPTINLTPQKEWDLIVPVTPGAAGTASVEAQLYRTDEPHSVYRKVTLTLPNQGGIGKKQVCSASQSKTTTFPVLASAYSGTIQLVSPALNIKSSLVKIKGDQGMISGYFNVGAGLNGSGPFKGTFAPTTYSIQFAVYDKANNAILLFQGNVQLNSDLSGTFCSLDHFGNCNDKIGYGLWNMAPISP